MYAPSHEGQSQVTKLLDLILNIIVVWNSTHMQQAVKELQVKNMDIEELIPHTSPIRWSHIQFYGEYMFSNKQLMPIDSIRLRHLKKN